MQGPGTSFQQHKGLCRAMFFIWKLSTVPMYIWPAEITHDYTLQLVGEKKCTSYEVDVIGTSTSRLRSFCPRIHRILLTCTQAGRSRYLTLPCAMLILPGLCLVSCFSKGLSIDEELTRICRWAQFDLASRRTHDIAYRQTCGAIGFGYNREDVWRFTTSQQCLALLILTERQQKLHVPCNHVQ